MRFGLEEHIVDSLISVFEEHSKVDKAIVFGSRAKGNYRPDSDIDIAIKGQELTTDDIILMAVAFEAEGITYKIDLIDYNKIKEPDLKAHIERVGIEFYSKWRETEIGVIPFNWDFEPMENYISLITYGFTNPMPTTDFGPYMLTAKDIFDGKIQYDDARRTSQEAYDNLLTEKSKPKINDVLITKDGSIGRVAIVEKEDMCISQSVALVRTNSRIKPLFLKYLLEAPQYQKIIQRDAGGSTIEHIYITRINKMFIGVPNLSTQDSIIDVIHSLQLKINLLQRQNKTLEQLAETLFRQWFVEEDQNGSLSEYIKVIGGYAFKSKDFKENGYAGIIKITNISMGYIDISRCDYVDKPVVENIDEKFKIKSGDFLIAMTGAEIGKIGIVEKTDKEIWLNQRVGRLDSKVPFGNYIGYMALKSKEGQEHIINACSGSAQENISSTGIEGMVFARYNAEKANLFGQEVEVLFQKIISNFAQIKALCKTRDALLPKLMSGEIRLLETSIVEH